ncbi:MAG: hypothetical protein U0800_05745 [Isosphaeraceae bacterium]
MRPTPPRQIDAGRRSGITLTEILIAILIMGVGLVSLATLFPLGLLRAQRAMRDSRSTLLAESAISEVNSRNLLSYETFAPTGWGCPWYTLMLDTFGNQVWDPWSVDRAVSPTPVSMTRFQAGLPVCYDPLWWSIVHQSGVGTPATLGLSSRFGIGNSTASLNTQGFLRNDADGQAPGAYGLQRITNFRGWIYNPPNPPGIPDPYEFVYNPPGMPNTYLPGYEVATDVFSSPDNVIFSGEDQEFPGQKAGDTSPLVPDLTISGGNPTYDLMFTWFFTGQRPNVGDKDQYVGSIVVCHNRVMGVETVTAPITGNTVTVPIGERTVEAIWGYSSTNVKVQNVNGNPQFYGTGERTVLLRWSNQMPDPQLRSGSYIADVTYNLDANLPAPLRDNASAYTGRRCDWYRVVGYTTPADDALAGFRSTVVTLETPVKAKTRLNNAGQPVYQNSALIMPSVVNVVPKSFVSRGAN